MRITSRKFYTDWRIYPHLEDYLSNYGAYTFDFDSADGGLRVKEKDGLGYGLTREELNIRIMSFISGFHAGLRESK